MGGHRKFGDLTKDLSAERGVIGLAVLPIG